MKQADAWLLVASCLSGFACGGTSPAGEPIPWPAGLPFVAAADAVVPDRLARLGIPGAAMAVIEHGSVASLRSYGFADKESRLPVTPATVFQVASISKSVAAWGILRLAEEGRLDLDGPVDASLSRWQIPPSAYDARGVTPRRLLSHTAGLSVHGYPGLEPSLPLPTLEQSLAGDNGGAGPVLLIQPPGAGFRYSGGGYTVLQLLVEETAGEPFSSYLDGVVLGPLGMASSAFTWRPELRPLTAAAYAESGQRLPNYLFTEQAAAGLYSTAPDFARFAAAGMRGANGEDPGRGIIAADTVQALQEPAPNTGGVYGLGLELWPLPGGDLAVGHGGANRGWRGRWIALPRTGSGLVVLTNSDAADPLLQELACRWSSEVSGSGPSWCR